MDRVEVEIRTVLRTTTIKKHKSIERWIITSENVIWQTQKQKGFE